MATFAESFCLFLWLKSWSGRGASLHLAFMDKCPTTSHTCQPYLPNRLVLLVHGVPESKVLSFGFWC